MASPQELPSTSLVIDEEEYSILEQPPEGSSLVLALKDDLYGELNLKDLVDHLKSVARFIRVTYYATGATPPVKEVQEIRLDIFHLGNNISKLCDQSASTVASFRSTSRTIMNELQAAYGYLADGLEDIAIYSLSTLSGHAEKMARAADKMRMKFEQQAKEVQEIAVKTMTTHDEHELRAEDKKKEKMQLEEDRKLAEKFKEDYRKYEDSAREKRMKYQEKEDAELENLDTSFWPTLGRLLLGQSGMEKAEEFRKTKIKYLEEELRQRKLRQEAMVKQASILKKIEDCRFDEIKYSMVAEFLHHAVTGLKGLAAVMQKAVFFWEKLQEHCQTLAEDGVKNKVASTMGYSKEIKSNVWASENFKKQAITYFAKWVALYSMCDEYLDEIRQTQKELYVYITENPTREECRAKLRELCQDFSKDADSSHAKSEQLNSRTRQEIEDLKKGRDDDEDF